MESSMEFGPVEPGSGPHAPGSNDRLDRMSWMLEMSRDIGAELTPSGDILFISPGVQAVLGYPPGDLRGKSVFKILHRDDFPPAHALEKPPEDEISCRGLHRDGSYRWLQIRVRNIVTAGGACQRVLFARDITEQSEMKSQLSAREERLRRSEKLEFLGSLSGRIAHDFNNILSAIIAYADLGRLEVTDNLEVRDCLEQVLIGGNRAKELVRQILTLSSRQMEKRRPIAFQPIVEEVLKLLRSTLTSSITVTTSFAEPAGVVLGDGTQLHQVVMNVCTNAAQSMARTGGRLEVSLRACVVTGKEPNAVRAGLNPGRYLSLAVTDSGPGMDDEILRRIFDPFFTTKPPGEGTGLGLAVVQTIVKDHRGAVEVISRPGWGTTFTLLLPLHESPASVSTAISGDIPQGQGQRVLLVEDEPALRVVGEKILKRSGYVPVLCASPREAIEQVQAAPSDVSLVITDLEMEGGTGLELAAELLKIVPSLPILLTTGSTDEWTTERVRLLGLRGVLRKPFLPVVLAREIHQILSAASLGASSAQPSSSP
jgi:PAS domain S-box-containing protein